MEITAMQELIELMGLDINLPILQKSLEKEKEQIMDARLDGFLISGEGWNGEYPFEGKSYEEISNRIENEEYYNQKYKNDTTGTNSNV